MASASRSKNCPSDLQSGNNFIQNQLNLMKAYATDVRMT